MDPPHFHLCLGNMKSWRSSDVSPNSLCGGKCIWRFKDVESLLGVVLLVITFIFHMYLISLHYKHFSVY